MALTTSGMHEKAIEFLEKQMVAAQKFNQQQVVCRCILSIILVLLAQVDFIGADRAYQKYLGVSVFPPSPEARLGAELLQAAQEANAEQFAKALRNPIIGFLDPELTRMALKIPIHEFQPTPQSGIEQFLMGPAIPSHTIPSHSLSSAAAAASHPVTHNSARIHTSPAPEYVPPVNKFLPVEPPAVVSTPFPSPPQPETFPSSSPSSSPPNSPASSPENVRKPLLDTDFPTPPASPPQQQDSPPILLTPDAVVDIGTAPISHNLEDWC
ncbi:MAG: hypothetical protein Q8P67_09005 [archaeon]|nr:hypothetical protein [archaeon]